MSTTENSQKKWRIEDEIHTARSYILDKDTRAKVDRFEDRCRNFWAEEQVGDYVLLARAMPWTQIKGFMEEAPNDTASGLDYVRSKSAQALAGFYVRSDGTTQWDFVDTKCSQLTLDQIASRQDTAQGKTRYHCKLVESLSDIGTVGTVLTEVQLPQSVLEALANDHKEGVIVRRMARICADGRKSGDVALAGADSGEDTESWKSELKELTEKSFADFEGTVTESSKTLGLASSS